MMKVFWNQIMAIYVHNLANGPKTRKWILRMREFLAMSDSSLFLMKELSREPA